MLYKACIVHSWSGIHTNWMAIKDPKGKIFNGYLLANNDSTRFNRNAISAIKQGKKRFAVMLNKIR